MDKSIFCFTIKQFLNRPFRLLIVTLFFIYPIFVTIMMSMMPGGYEKAGMSFSFVMAPTYALIIGSGAIGQDVSDGILPLIFSRPLKRWKYVISKWIAISMIAMVITVINLMVTMTVAESGSFGWVSDLKWQLMVDIILNCAGATSVIFLLSSLLRGLADLGIIILLQLVSFFSTLIEACFKVPGMAAVGESINLLLYPGIQVSHIKGWSTVSYVDITRYLAIVSICILGAVVLLNQKELSYGSD